MPKYLNQFKSPDHIEETIVDEDGATVGTIRVKPTSVLWKPKGQHQFYAVPLTKFATWITSPGTAAKRAKK
jgi:hypothetical protein